MVARYLADRVRAETDPPPLHIHSLTAGFRVEDPQTSPNSFCNFYREVPGMSYTGLFVPPYAMDLDWRKTRETGPGIQESFRQRSAIDIVITSLASADDDHGELNRFMKMYGDLSKSTPAQLRKAGRVGDVMYRPYNDTRPIRFDDEMRRISRQQRRERAEDLDYLLRYLEASEQRTGTFMDNTQEALAYLALRGDPRVRER